MFEFFKYRGKCVYMYIFIDFDNDLIALIDLIVHYNTVQLDKFTSVTDGASNLYFWLYIT